MERHIVKHRENLIAIEFSQHLLPINPWCQKDVVHVGIVLAAFRNDGPAQQTVGLYLSESRMIALPNR